jgi:hypothetical protein
MRDKRRKQDNGMIGKMRMRKGQVIKIKVEDDKKNLFEIKYQ